MMFSNFVIFTEVVKLSENIYYQMRDMNYFRGMLKKLKTKDIKIAKEVIQTFLEKCEKHEKQNITCLIDNYYLEENEAWLRYIFEAVSNDEDIDVSEYIETILIFACEYDNLEVLKYYVSRGFDIKDSYDETNVLSLSASYNNLGAVTYLVNSGYDIHSLDNSALAEACYEGHYRIAKFLLQNGANPNAQNGELLNIRNKQIRKLLIKYGANVN